MRVTSCDAQHNLYVGCAKRVSSHQPDACAKGAIAKNINRIELVAKQTAHWVNTQHEHCIGMFCWGGWGVCEMSNANSRISRKFYDMHIMRYNIIHEILAVMNYIICVYVLRFAYGVRYSESHPLMLLY